ncbi:MAG: hypothetical protein OXF98_06660 [Rhodospirillaceae bacterium]|nr:hypothetical protein [Rhodospirillaceae bacterium]
MTLVMKNPWFTAGGLKASPVTWRCWSRPAGPLAQLRLHLFVVPCEARNVSGFLQIHAPGIGAALAGGSQRMLKATAPRPPDAAGRD